MAKPNPRPHPPGKSKTDLRRGQFTAGAPSPKKSGAPTAGQGTTREEEAMLLAEPPDGGT